MWEVFEKLREQRGVSVYRVAKDCGMQPGMFSNWKAGRYVPKADKMQVLADYFGVSVEYLMTGETPTEYYLNDDVAEIAREIYENPDLRALFDAARGSDAKDVNIAKQILILSKATNPDG